MSELENCSELESIEQMNKDEIIEQLVARLEKSETENEQKEERIQTLLSEKSKLESAMLKLAEKNERLNSSDKILKDNNRLEKQNKSLMNEAKKYIQEALRQGAAKVEDAKKEIDKRRKAIEEREEAVKSREYDVEEKEDGIGSIIQQITRKVEQDEEAKHQTVTYASLGFNIMMFLALSLKSEVIKHDVGTFVQTIWKLVKGVFSGAIDAGFWVSNMAHVIHNETVANGLYYDFGCIITVLIWGVILACTVVAIIYCYMEIADEWGYGMLGMFLLSLAIIVTWPEYISECTDINLILLLILVNVAYVAIKKGARKLSYG